MMFCHEFEKLGKEIEGTDYELPLKAQPNENVLGKNWIKIWDIGAGLKLVP